MMSFVVSWPVVIAPPTSATRGSPEVDDRKIVSRPTFVAERTREWALVGAKMIDGVDLGPAG